MPDMNEESDEMEFELDAEIEKILAADEERYGKQSAPAGEDSIHTAKATLWYTAEESGGDSILRLQIGPIPPDVAEKFHGVLDLAVQFVAKELLNGATLRPGLDTDAAREQALNQWKNADAEDEK